MPHNPAQLNLANEAWCVEGAVGEFLTLENGEFVGLTAANNGVAFADAVQEILAVLQRDSTISARCRAQAEEFPWSKTINRLETIGTVAAA